MDLKIIKKDEKELHMEFEGESHTLLNLLRTELLKDERVTYATYDTKFTIMDNPIFKLRTRGEDPLEIMKQAASRITAQCDEFLQCYNAAVER